MCVCLHKSSVKFSQRTDELYGPLDYVVLSQSRCAVGFVTTYEVRESISGVREDTASSS